MNAGRNRSLLLIPLVLLILQRATAQDPQFSQFYAAPQFVNPALTGNTHQDRIGLNYRLQWPGVQPGYETYMAAYDHRFSTVNAGIGGMVLRDKAGTNGLTFTTIGLSYSYEARINYKRAVRGGLRLGYTMRGTDPSGYLFADQVIRDNASQSVEANLVEQVSYLDMAAGFMYYSEQFYVGTSFNHINRPNQSLILGGDARLQVRTSVHAGYSFATDGRSFSKADTRMTLAAHYKAQGKWDQFDVGFYLHHRQLLGGLWYRGLPIVKAYQQGYGNDESVILMAGLELDQQFRVIYSYDITISKLTMRSGGAHEISLQYEWPRKAKNRKHRTVPCPKF